MGRKDPRRWRQVGDRFERAASDGRTWRVRPVGPGWRLERHDPKAVGWLGGPGVKTTPIWDAPTLEACQEVVAGIDRHEAVAERLAGEASLAERPTHIPGVTIVGRRSGGQVEVRAVLQVEGERDRTVGSYHAFLSNWTTARVLGETTFDGASTVEGPYVGKGLGRALYDLAEEMAGVPLTPHGRFGAGGSRSPDSIAFWDKRAARQRVPGVGDPEVALRDAERLRVRELLALASPDAARHPHLAAAVAAATGWDVAYATSPDGDWIEEAWCIDGNDKPFSGMGPDTGEPTILARNGNHRPEVVRTDAAGFMRVVEGSPWYDGDVPDVAAAHREAVAEQAACASLVLERYAGIAVCGTELRERIAAPSEGVPSPAL